MGAICAASAYIGATSDVARRAQAADINALFGFRIECVERLGDPHGIWAWTRLNALFNWLPLAACIEDKILCMHGGAAPCSLQEGRNASLAPPIRGAQPVAQPRWDGRSDQQLLHGCSDQQLLRSAACFLLLASMG